MTQSRSQGPDQFRWVLLLIEGLGLVGEVVFVAPGRRAREGTYVSVQYVGRIVFPNLFYLKKVPWLGDIVVGVEFIPVWAMV